MRNLAAIPVPRPSSGIRPDVVRVWAAALLLAVALGACESMVVENGSTEPTSGFWPKPWSETTCREWRDEATSSQRFLGAGEIIRALRSVGGLRDNPELASGMMSAITNVCSALPDTDTSSVGDLAIVIYKADATIE